MIVAIGLGVLFFLLAIGTPVGFAMIASGVIGLWLVGGMPMLSGILETAPLSTVGAYELITIPMFLLMAELVLLSGVRRRPVPGDGGLDGPGARRARHGDGPGGCRLRRDLRHEHRLGGDALGDKPAGDAQAGLRAGDGRRRRRDFRHARHADPARVALVIFGLLAEVNIGALLIGGIIPGLLVMLTIMATVYVLVLLDPSRAPPAKPVPWREKIAWLKVVGPMVVLFGAVTGVIYTGIATPTEASALGAAGALAIAAWYGKVDGAGAGAGPAPLRQRHLHDRDDPARRADLRLFLLAYPVTQTLVAWVGALEVSRSG
ncbi:TRAP transporter large permease protein OS=Bosea thiooxidans OX=53254 GN=ARD30_14870 PE=3 SV=1 [Bosea thiooxidans]